MAKSHPSAKDGRPLVIVVDDDAAVRSSYRFFLETEGFEVRTYAAPGDLLSDKNLPSSGCLIVNYQMPAMNGLELIATLRGRGISLPAILATGHSDGSLRSRAATAGVAMIEKPLLGNALLDAINQLIQSR